MVALSYGHRLSTWPWVAPWVALFALAEARADDAPWRCGERSRPWVELRFEGTGWEPRLQQSIRADLAAGLRLRGLLVCPIDRPGLEASLATVQLSAASINKVSVEIEVHDALTNKFVLREVDLRNVSADARGLALAAAAEELLRASWAELALEDAPAPAREPPPEVTAAVRPGRVALRDDYVLGLRVIGEHHAGGQTLIGPEVWCSLWLSQHFAAELSIGYRRGLTVSSRHGSIESQAAVFGVDAVIAFAGRSSRLLLLTRIGLQFANVEYQGRADRAGVGAERSGVHVAARAGLVLRLALGDHAELRLEAGPGVSLRALSAYDGRNEVTGTRGVLGHADLGFGAGF